MSAPETDLVLPQGLFRGRGRTLAAAEMDLLSHLIGVPDTDAGRQPVHPQVVAAVVVSLSALGRAQDQLEADLRLHTLAALAHSGTVGAPVHPGDTLHTETVFTGLRPTASRPGRFVLSIRDTACNQRGDVVMTVERRILMAADGAGAS